MALTWSFGASANPCSFVSGPDRLLLEYVNEEQKHQDTLIGYLKSFVARPNEFLSWRNDPKKAGLDEAVEFASFVLAYKESFSFVRLTSDQQRRILWQYLAASESGASDLYHWLFERNLSVVQSMHSRSRHRVETYLASPADALNSGLPFVRAEFLARELGRAQGFAVGTPGLTPPDGSIIVVLPKIEAL